MHNMLHSHSDIFLTQISAKAAQTSGTHYHVRTARLKAHRFKAMRLAERLVFAPLEPDTGDSQADQSKSC